jgi:hypothetical protein
MSLARDVTRDARPDVIAVLRSGLLAENFCRRGGDAEVAALFQRSFYLRVGDTFVCVGASGIGNGPLTLIADIGGSVRWADLGLRPGRRADISARHITIGDAIRFSLAACEPWRSPAWPAAAPHADPFAVCIALTCRAAAEAPAVGFAPVAFGAREAVAGVTPFLRIARKRIARFESWLAAALASSPSPRLRGEGRGEGLFPHAQTRGESPSPGAQERADLSPRSKSAVADFDHSLGDRSRQQPTSDAGRGGVCGQLRLPCRSTEAIRGLIGLGPGLTPSGDDFLSGGLALLNALAMRKIHAALAQAVTDAAPALTSPLSACLLKAAADGYIGEDPHRAVTALILGDIDTAIAAARRIGHSSGWDMLAGAATTLRIVAQAPAAPMKCASART